MIRQDCKIVLALPEMPAHDIRVKIYRWWHQLTEPDKCFVRELAEEWMADQWDKTQKPHA